jgi:hypothetical protein
MPQNYPHTISYSGKRIQELLASEKFEERFWAKVEKTETCWNWTAAKGTGGYGLFTLVHHLSVGAHRIAYFLAHRGREI